MRDPKRIDEIIQVLWQLWKTYPDLRLGQIIVSATGKDDPFHVEDDVTLKGLCGMLGGKT